MFLNEAPSDFSIPEQREMLRQALAAFEARRAAGNFYSCPLIGGSEIRNAADVFPSLDPSCSDVTIGPVELAGDAQLETALQAAVQGAAELRAVSCEDRAQWLRTLASKLRSNRAAMTALIIREAGKPWKEADADIVEAIDFCEYYADEMCRLAQPRRMSNVLGEENLYFYQPRGVALVIAPWNFPLAIACGMTTAALVAGNAAILKPSSQTAVIAFEFAKLILESGFPPNTFTFLPCSGRTVGSALVKDRRVSLICFTGSREVGLGMIASASQTPEGQQHVKRVIAEMGGKNAIIVDEDADLDEAVRGSLYSAFGYAGQKCSACSRLIVVGDAYEPFMTRFCNAARDLIVGRAEDPATYVGPVIDQASQERIQRTIGESQKHAQLAFHGQAPAGGFFVAPAVFRDVEPESLLWREEIFGPVLACRQAADLSEAITLAEECQYALTGGIYSRSPANIQRVITEFRVGNFYVNRPITGAIVGRQPFGGFKLSGIGSKAGGPDYLLQFLEPRTISENTMRKGFAPEMG